MAKYVYDDCTFYLPLSLPPHACCLLGEFALFYAKLTTAGFSDPVTALASASSPGLALSGRAVRSGKAGG